MECTEHNLITRVWAFCHSQSDHACFDYLSRETYAKHTAMEQKRIDLRSFSPALRINLWLLLVIYLFIYIFIYSMSHLSICERCSSTVQFNVQLSFNVYLRFTFYLSLVSFSIRILCFGSKIRKLRPFLNNG